MSDLSIVNVVGGGSIGREIDLSQTAQDFPETHVEYDPSSFEAVIIRYEDPKATIMLYSSGKYSLAGAQSVDGAKSANRIFISDIEQMIQSQLSNKTFEVRYLVATADLGSQIDLNGVMVQIGIEETEYEPEQFPALFYRPANVQWFYSIFGSGKVVINGCESVEQLKQAYIDLKTELTF
jgi:transcription initiation factor TFIID TATA-box-binding protein